ncbi:hypothetical protein J1614_002966 [Plenodomus biglobosus]|nr:hypothetical protein J1614_002966 [Plenodomus biglobosus]
MFGKSSLLFLAVAAGIQVAHADFMVYTEPPIPTSAIPSFANPSDAASWTTSVFLNARLAYGRFTSSLGEPYQSSLTSARSEIDEWVRSGPSFVVPSEVTIASETPTYFSKPDWYDALPTGARAFKEQQVADQFSIVRSVISAREPTSSTSSAAAAQTLAPQWMRKEFGVLAGAAVLKSKSPDSP